MRFVDKVFACVVGVSLAATLTVFALNDRRSAASERADFFGRYESVGRQLGMTFTEVERATDSTVLNAVNFFRLYIAQHGVPDMETMQALAQTAQVHGLGVYDEHGISGVFSTSRSSVGALDLFKLCDDYRNLLNGQTRDLVLPFAPKIRANDYGWAAQKFAFVASDDKKWILTALMLTTNLWSFLQNAVNADDHVLQIAMLMQSGEELAKVVSPHLKDTPVGDVPLVQGPDDLRGAGALARLRFVVPSSCPVCCECQTKGSLKDANDTSYRMEMVVSLAPLRAARAARLRYMATVAGLVVLTSALVGRALAKRLVRRVEQISDTTHRVLQTGDLSVRAAEGAGSDEISALARGFNTMMRALRENEAHRAERAGMAAMAKVAAQAAHDIRSPVAALQVVAEQSTDWQQEQRMLVLGAVRRVSDIANNLLSEHRTHDAQARPRSEFIAPLVHSVVSQQRAVHAKRGLDHAVSISAAAQQAFCAVDPGLMRDVLSNLLNNAAEAAPDGGKVAIGVTGDDAHLVVRVVDQGCGIAPEHMERVLGGGFTTKERGNGLGLSGALQAVRGWGGNLTLKSKVGVGTTVTITLPRVAPQPWFAKSIHLPAGKTVFVLDDVEAMSRVWHQRLRGLDVQVRTFTRADQFIAAVSADRDALGMALVDYDLLGDTRNGLDVIAALSIADASLLVTSYYEEEAVRRRCLAMGVCIVPKTLAATVPLDVVTPNAQARAG